MNLLSDIITYVRRLIKTPSNAVISDNLIIDYINRFWMMDVDARVQLFDLKTTYQFMTSAAVDRYNMPLYNVQNEGGQDVGSYPLYQGFFDPVYINGIQIAYHIQRQSFFNVFPNVDQQQSRVALGDGGQTYSFTLPVLGNVVTPLSPPLVGILRGHIDISGIISRGINEDPPVVTTLDTDVPFTSTYPAFYLTAIDSTGGTQVVSDSGQFLLGNVNYGLLMKPGNISTLGNTSLGAYTTTSNTINYLTGEVNVTFPVPIPDNAAINATYLFFQTGLPRAVLYYNNTLTLRVPPDTQYLVELGAYLSPAAFLNSAQAIQFGYMAEYIARGAARKILADTGDWEQFNAYEPLFREQEHLVWKRSQRQWTSTRVETIYSAGFSQNYPLGGLGGGGSSP